MRADCRNCTFAVKKSTSTLKRATADFKGGKCEILSLIAHSSGWLAAGSVGMWRAWNDTLQSTLLHVRSSTEEPDKAPPLCQSQGFPCLHECAVLCPGMVFLLSCSDRLLFVNTQKRQPTPRMIPSGSVQFHIHTCLSKLDALSVA